MKINMRKTYSKKKAFTLIEVLIVLIIIAALAGLLYIAFGGSSESAKKAACEGEREKIKNAYAMQRYASGGNFQTAIKTVMDDVPQASADSLGSSEAKYEGLCGDGGIYTIQPASISLFISCDKHGGETQAQSSSGTLTLYTTTFTFSSSNKWNSSADFVAHMNAGNVTFAPGTVIQIGDVCYAALGTVTSSSGGSPQTYLGYGNSQFKSIPSSQTSSVDWNTTKSAGGGYSTGDICQYGGSYYIANQYVGAGDMQTTPDKSSAWLKLVS